jgi:Tol biopolymer transport system component
MTRRGVSRGTGLLRRTTIAVWAAASVLVGAGPATAATSTFGAKGEEAGQFNSARGLAINQETGDLFLADTNNARVDEFTREGAFVRAWGWGVADGASEAPQTCTATCAAGLEGAGAGQFSRPLGLAVDNDALSASHGDVYVADRLNHRVEKFDPDGKFILMFGGEVDKTKDEEAGASEAERNVCTAASGDRCGEGTEGKGNGQFEFWSGRLSPFIAVGSTGSVYVGDENRVQQFSPEGAYQSELTLPGAGATFALAVDTAGDLYVKSGELSGVRKYSPAGALLQELDTAGSPSAIAVNPAGDIFIDDGEDEVEHHILEYDSSGNELSSFDAAGEGGSRGIGWGDTAGALYVLGLNGVREIAPPPPGPLLEPGSESATNVRPTTATLNATIDPEGQETTYRFEYGPSTSYGTSAPVPDGASGSDFADHAVSASLTSLQHASTYHYRVVATNAGGTAQGPDQTFTTLPPARIDSESVSDVTSTGATLAAEINPLGSDTRYRFEYGTSTSYGTAVPVPDGGAGSGERDAPVAVRLRDLQPATTYHFRAVTSNVLGSVAGEDRTFSTQPDTAGPALADGRGWEMVAPPGKDGATIEAITPQGGVIQASGDGGSLTYVTTAAVGGEPAGSPAKDTQVLSVRHPDGWRSTDIATPHEQPAGFLLGHPAEYEFFSPDLTAGLVQPLGETPLPPLPAGSEKTIYLRDNPAGSYLPLVTAANVPPGTKFGLNPQTGAGEMEFVSATPDLTHVVISSQVALTPAPIAASSGLYEWAAGHLELVSVLPGPNQQPAPQPTLGDNSHSIRHAISNDGSRVVWSATQSGALDLYLRDTTTRETIQLDAVASGKGEGNPNAVFQTASSDGSKVFFTDQQRLTADSKAEEHRPDLYEFEVSSGSTPLAGTLTDLTGDANAGESADVQGAVIGASEDGAYVYYVAEGVLAVGENGHMQTATPGAENLYLARRSSTGWTTTFVATLASEDGPDWEAGTGSHNDLGRMTARVSPNGSWLAFMSDRSLTGYDNHDANSGAADEEVFLYDAVAHSLTCPSCNPTGARPSGVLDHSFTEGNGTNLLIDRPEIWTEPGRWLAASVPGWTKADADRALYQSRYLADSGRLFFNSADALAPQDNNGMEDVYEYEPTGVGSCTNTNHAFSDRAAGCVSLISSATSGGESAFLDASASGSDVFFLTAAPLALQDVDTGPDIYDARVCADAAPCLASPGTPRAACSTTESCKAPPSPQPPILGAPPSATFSGSGNLPPAAHAPPVKRSLTRAQKLARALRACRKKPKKKRAACESTARRQYKSKRPSSARRRGK